MFIVHTMPRHWVYLKMGLPDAYGEKPLQLGQDGHLRFPDEGGMIVIQCGRTGGPP
jgi:hypothetical protein